MDRTYCDACGRDITACAMRSPEAQKKVQIHDGYAWMEQKLCKRCFKRLWWLLENDRYKEAILNMTFRNRVRMALMLPLEYGKPEETDDGCTGN